MAMALCDTMVLNLKRYQKVHWSTTLKLQKCKHTKAYRAKQVLGSSANQCTCNKNGGNKLRMRSLSRPQRHGLRTPNEGINQRNLKIWADVADKICFSRNLNIWEWVVDFRPCSEGNFLSGRP